MTQTPQQQQQQHTPEPSVSVIQPIDLSTINPADGSIVNRFVDPDGSFQRLLAQRVPSSQALSDFVPDVPETNLWNALAWLIWVEAMQRLVAGLNLSQNPKRESKPYADLTPSERVIQPVTLSTGENGVQMAAFTVMEPLPDPERDLLSERLKKLHTFVSQGVSQSLSLRNNRLFTEQEQQTEASPPDTTSLQEEASPTSV